MLRPGSFNKWIGRGYRATYPYLLGLYFGSAIKDPFSLGLDMVMACFLLAMVVDGKKDLRVFAIWVVAALSSLLAYWYLPTNSHVIVGALAGGTFGAIWMGKKA